MRVEGILYLLEQRPRLVLCGGVAGRPVPLAVGALLLERDAVGRVPGARLVQRCAPRSLADAERIANLELQAMQTPANDAPCLPEDAAKRVGDVQ